MRPFVLTPALVVVGMFVATQTAAQSRSPVPNTGMLAVSGSIGVSPPTDASFQNGVELTGAVEGYLTPRVSIRGQVAGSSWDITGRGFRGSTKPFMMDGNLVYNW